LEGDLVAAKERVVVGWISLCGACSDDDELALLAVIVFT